MSTFELFLINIRKFVADQQFGDKSRVIREEIEREGKAKLSFNIGSKWYVITIRQVDSKPE